MSFLQTHWQELMQLIGEHLFLVFVSTGLAVLIGIPLAIAMIEWTFLRRPILNFANLMQTIPTLALFGFLIPISGIGPQTAIAALFLYALLPIVQNTYTGIQSIDPATREAGIGMGMTKHQLLWRVEIPLALVFIIAGIRIACVISVGTATIAALVDAGGLGRYIFRGLRMNDTTLLLAGAIPAALIAIGLNLVFEQVEKWVKEHRKMGRYAWCSILIFGALAWVPFKQQEKIHIGCKDFTEQLILGEIFAQTIESQLSIPVERHFDLGGQLTHQALVKKKIDLEIEYTGTAYSCILHLPSPASGDTIYETVKNAYERQFDLIWGEPLGFSNTFVILVRPEDAQKFQLKTVSDLIAIAPKMKAGFGQDFLSRSDGYEGLVKAYGLKFQDVREMDFSLVYKALNEGQVDIMVGNTTDGQIEEWGLIPLEDDRHYFINFDAAPVMTHEIYPKLKPALDLLAGQISVEEMRRLNTLVEKDKRSITEVVKSFLQEKFEGNFNAETQSRP